MHDVAQTFFNLLLFRSIRQKKAKNRFLESLENGVADDILQLLLDVMSLTLLVDKKFRKNIENFSGCYVFQDKTGKVYVVANFDKNKLKVSAKKIDIPTFTLIFRDGNSLIKFLLSPSPDILNALLNQEIDFFGNINYINKFAYMAMHLKLAVSGV
jgi:hypothetical protein